MMILDSGLLFWVTLYFSFNLFLVHFCIVMYFIVSCTCVCNFSRKGLTT